MTDHTFSGPPDPEDPVDDAIARLDEALCALVADAADDTEAIIGLVGTTGWYCSLLTHQIYGQFEWSDDEDRDLVAHLVSTLERLCSHIDLGLRTLHGLGKDRAWTLLDGAAHRRLEILAAIQHGIDGQTEDISGHLDAALDPASTVRLDRAYRATRAWDDEWSVDPTVARIEIVTSARRHRTPDLFLDEAALDESYRRFAVELLRATLHDVTVLTVDCNVRNVMTIAAAVGAADAVRLERFHGRQAA